jgi:hypothetical protein
LAVAVAEVGVRCLTRHTICISWPPYRSKAVVSAVKAAIWLLDANGTTSSLADSDTETKHNVATRSSNAGEHHGCMVQQACMLRPAGEKICKQQGARQGVCCTVCQGAGWLEPIGS